MNKLVLFLVLVGTVPDTTRLTDLDEPTPTNEKGQFVKHGLAAPFSNHRGIIATVDNEGRNAVMLWLFDRRGGYALLMIDAVTGASEQFPMPFDIGGDSPYASLFSSEGKLYTLFNGNFVEFDPKKRAFTFHHKTAPQMAMGMTEDDQGRVWAVTYPNSGVVCFDPKTGELTDYGHVHKENWAQYQRYMAADDLGWVYFAIGNTDSQLIAFHPNTREVKPLLQPAERQRGTAFVYRNQDGKVYGQAIKEDHAGWYELYQGAIKPIGGNHQINAKNILTGTQALSLLEFPDGRRVKKVDLINRRLIIENLPGEEQTTVDFDYTTAGTWVMGVGASPDKRSIIGGSAFPMRLLTYAVDEDSWGHQAAYGQFNALTTYGKYAFFGSYPGGNLIAWDTEMPYTGSRAGEDNSNPRILMNCSPLIYRPHRVLVHPDGKMVLMGGTPDYGYTGGGLLFYDMESHERVLLSDNDVVENQSTMSLTTLKDGKVLGGTTIAPGTGGERKASLAELYITDVTTKKIEWRGSVIPGTQTYTDLATRADGKVYGIADYQLFFVFDPDTREVIYQKDVSDEFGRTVAEQSPRVFVKGTGEDLYVLFGNAITQIDHDSYGLKLLARTPQPIRAGGDYLNGRIYYISGSYLWSYGL